MYYVEVASVLERYQLIATKETVEGTRAWFLRQLRVQLLTSASFARAAWLRVALHGALDVNRLPCVSIFVVDF